MTTARRRARLIGPSKPNGPVVPADVDVKSAVVVDGKGIQAQDD